MKKMFVAIMMAGSVLTASAVNKYDVSRAETSSQMKAEQVGAKITLNKITEGKAPTVSVRMSPSCISYHLECLPSEVAGQIPNADVLVRYLNNMKRVKHTENLNNVKLVDLGNAFQAGKSYTLLSVGYDQNGEFGYVDRVNFTMPKQAIKGTPKVKIQVLKVQEDKVELRFTPNKDVAGYGLCVFKKGTIEQSLKQHGRQMGFSTVAEMIKRFSGKNYTAVKTNTWKDLIPNTEYDFCVQMWDKNGLYTQLEKVTVKTKVLGGKGIAKVTIQKGEFGGSASTGYYQIIKYIPNNQSALHRDIIITEEAYNKKDMGKAGILKMLKQDQPRNPYWDQYRIDKAQWNAKPNTKYIAFSLAKNAKGVWGPLNQLKFTTPAK